MSVVWPCTLGYVRASADGMNLPLRIQWRDGGLEDEMLRADVPTKGVWYEDSQGGMQYLPPSTHGKHGT